MSMFDSVDLSKKASVVDLSQHSAKEMTEKEIQEFESKRKHITLQDLPEFPQLMSTMYTDSYKFCQSIGNLLRPIFNDFYGARLDVVQNQGIYLYAFFTPTNAAKDSRKINAVEPIVDTKSKSSDSIINAMNHLYSYGSSKTMKITKEADELLRDIIHDGAINYKTTKVQWDRVAREGNVSEANGFNYSSNRPVMQIMLDPNKLLKVMYGDRTTDNGTWEYMITVGNPINPTRNAFGELSASTWQLFIMRCNSRDVKAKAADLGLVFGGNDLGIITG